MQHSKHSQTSQFRLCLQELEDRSVPAGNIAAQVFDGVLYILGDTAGNQFSINGAGDHSAIIRSLDSTTTINGQSTPVAFSGISKGIHILGRNADDVIQINGFEAEDTINITGGGGDDQIQMNGVETGGGGIIVTASGNDQLILNNCTFGSLLSVSMRDGDDFVKMGFNKFDETLLLNGGSGSNTYMTLGTTFDETFFPGTFVIGGPPTPDTQNPTATITPSTSEPTPISPIPFTVTFSEPVTGFTSFDLNITNGTAINFTAVSSTRYTFGVTPAADGPITVSITAGAAQDLDGNPSVAATGNAFSLRTAAGLSTTIPDTNAPNFVPIGTQGLKVLDVQTGVGTVPAQANSTVTAFYRGFLASNGTVFDDSDTTGSPTQFMLPQTIAGFQQGIVGMRAGGIRRIFIPAALGYGANPPAGLGIPPNADLVFEVKLVTVSQ